MKIGDRVVCIENFIERPTLPAGLPKKGEIYTYDGISDLPEYIRLEEYPHIISKSGRRIAFLARCFRPLLAIDLWNRDEQESYLEYLEQIAPGVERETVEK